MPQRSAARVDLGDLGQAPVEAAAELAGVVLALRAPATRDDDAGRGDARFG